MSERRANAKPGAEPGRPPARGIGIVLGVLFVVLGVLGGLVGGGLFGGFGALRDLVGSEAQADGHELTATLGVFGPRSLGSAVYPKQEIPLSFQHSKHIAAKIACERCHTGIRESTKSADNNFPRGVSCDGCHGAQHPRATGAIAQCELCHTRAAAGRVTATLQAPRPNLHFDHKAHLARGATCTSCHGDMSRVRLATVLQLPSEASCLTCHDGVKASNRCATCHPAQSDGRLLTRDHIDRTSPMLVPKGPSSWGAAHDLNFVEDHRGIAKANPSLCAQCHTQSECLDCHTGAVRPMRIHAADYMTTHALDARAGTQDCQSCHRVQTECMACHQRLGLGDGPDASSGVGSSMRFHPADFAGPPGTPQTHAFAAQRNITACASCHTEDSCLACHATTAGPRPGLGSSPHGVGFGGSVRCQALAARNHRVCLKCHAPGDPRNDCL